MLFSCFFTAQLQSFVFAYAKSWFSHDTTHILMPKKMLRVLQNGLDPSQTANLEAV